MEAGKRKLKRSSKSVSMFVTRRMWKKGEKKEVACLWLKPLPWQRRDTWRSCRLGNSAPDWVIWDPRQGGGFVAAKSLKRPDFMLPFSSFFSFYLLYTANMEMFYIDCMYGHMLRANDCKYLTCLSFSSYIASVWYLHAILDLTIILQRSTWSIFW